MTRLAPSCATRSGVGRHRAVARPARGTPRASARTDRRPSPCVYAHGMRMRRRLYIILSNYPARAAAPGRPRIRAISAGATRRNAERARTRMAQARRIRPARPRAGARCARRRPLGPVSARRRSRCVSNERDHVWHMTHAIAVRTPRHSLGDTSLAPGGAITSDANKRDCGRDVDGAAGPEHKSTSCVPQRAVMRCAIHARACSARGDGEGVLLFRRASRPWRAPGRSCRRSQSSQAVRC